MNGNNPLPNPREKEIFWEALKLSTPEDVVAYLNQVCAGDQNLRTSVEALLKNHKIDGKLESPSEKVGENIGDTIDDYKLSEKIGEGGGGVVFRAQQQKPIQRQVALKVINQKVAAGQMLKRFQAEIQALASLEHLYIARVYHAGTTKDGLPYFTMEFVGGNRITDYADKYYLTIPERLELFGKVCKAVQFAHEKGFIHRDIKPSNILVYQESGEHVPKVIDFGIAKAIDEDEKFNAYATRTGQLVGTPAYMSPEQASLEKEEVDTRSDIYSLGVLLYELLVGYAPFDLTGLTLDLATKTIREKTPELPSSRVNESGDKTIFRIAKLRRIDPSQFKTILEGDLDRIVMRCLEKRQPARYNSVNSLAADIEYCQNRLASHSERDGWKKSLTNILLLFAGIGIVLLAALVVISIFNRQPDQQQAQTEPVPFQTQAPSPPKQLPTSETTPSVPHPKPSVVEATPPVPHPQPVVVEATPFVPTQKPPVPEITVPPLLQPTSNEVTSAPSQPQSSIATNKISVPTTPQVPPESPEYLANKDIYLKTQRAVNAPTFEGAVVILNQINNNKITDSDLASYVAMSKEIADFSILVGIPRSSGTDFSSIMQNADLVALAGQVISHPFETIRKAYKIKKDLPEFDDLTQTLEDRYSSD